VIAALRLAHRARGVLLLALLLVLPGCALSGFFAAMFRGSELVPAAHELETERTAIVVDDPERAFTQSGLTGRLASNVHFHLKQNTELKDKHLVELRTMRDIKAGLGERYERTPLAEIGRQAEAEQLIHVLVRSVAFQQTGGLYRPEATVEVKVIDVASGEPRFPAVEDFGDLGPKGHSVRVRLKPRRMDRSQRTAELLVSQTLAEQTGKRVAQLFYRHEPPGPDSEMTGVQ